MLKCDKMVFLRRSKSDEYSDENDGKLSKNDLFGVYIG
jgi:hypothetical protein